MYSEPNLDAPPPRSQFRRPWSPEAYTPHPPGRFNDDDIEYDVYDPTDLQPHQRQHQSRREASDASVEALDLADYSRTLRHRQTEDPYPAFPSRTQNRQPSSFPTFLTSYETMPTELSRGPTLTSLTTHSSEVHTTRRPFSLPATPIPPSHAHSSLGMPHIVDPEVDITHFPRFTRNWYDHQHEQDYDMPVPQLAAQPKMSPFDPAYVHDVYGHNSSKPMLSSGNRDSRDILPWRDEVQQYVDPLLREERMRMLEREFGSKQDLKTDHGGLVDADGKPLIGTVDNKGRLVTVGPKRRIFFRLFQIALAAGACIPAIYAAVAIKSDSKNPPPPANKPPVYVLYILSSVSLLVLLYMFIVRPCCCIRRKPRSRQPNMGMMVLPVGGPGGKKKKNGKGGKKGKRGYGPSGAQDLQVNLIVDPAAFHGPDADDSDSEDGYDSHDGSMPGGFGGAGRETPEQRARRKKRARKNRRKGIVEGMAMEEEWRAARSWVKRVAVIDVAGLVVWGAAFVFIMTGKRCPSGGFNGWCNAYNVSSACACLLAVAFGVTTFFDVQDLHASKLSPRTRI